MKNKNVVRLPVAALLVVAVLATSAGCGITAPVTRLKLEKGLVGGGVWQEDTGQVDYVLNMLDVGYTALEAGDPASEEVKKAASVVMEVYEGLMTATVYATNDCRILVEGSDGGLWYAQTPAVDTVLICAAFREGEVSP